MAFVTEVNVEAELSYSITDSTQPTSTELTDIIADIEAEVKGYLYAARINSASINSSATPDCFRSVKLVCLWGICSRVIAAAGGLVRSTQQKEDSYWERYVTKLAQINEKPTILGDDTPFLTSFPSINIDGLTEDSDEYHEPVFAIDDVF